MELSQCIFMWQAMWMDGGFSQWSGAERANFQKEMDTVRYNVVSLCVPFMSMVHLVLST